MTVLSIKGLSKVYGQGQNEVKALNHIELKVKKGEFVAIMGTSGSGKSTLLNMISGLDSFEEGEILLSGENIKDYSDYELTRLRREKVGFIFQFFHLIPVLSAIENVTLPAMFTSVNKGEVQKKAHDLLRLVGLGSFIHSKPNVLSGGQQQRIAIARALINEPELILADEPTGSLDSKTSKEMMNILQQFSSELRHTLILVTHDANVASYANRVVFMYDGKIADTLDLSNSGLDSQEKIRVIASKVEVLSL
ncbi:ABC transporter ATP-binding protein [Pseudogracilibacillus auburnensis]|uniref:ABC transporter ATP-binding protein n=1 Tax=Pseudogracilibacillus auburnensis TaxID=1494959 RepID=UPI001A95DCDA|nr:ABC transporter ATP-binding protein [Pseudogracilibacillus auburnensis]MBO1001245.1 ABC transporter ATP-binding protein [Pseudogracilibacillus auburnensis]